MTVIFALIPRDEVPDAEYVLMDDTGPAAKPFSLEKWTTNKMTFAGQDAPDLTDPKETF